MIRAEIEIGQIDYEKTIRSLFPAAMEQSRKLRSDHLLLRFLIKVGDAAQEVLLQILNLLSPSAKNELLCTLVNFFAPDLTRKINELIQSSQLANRFFLDDISLEPTPEGGLSLSIGRISADYAGLLDLLPAKNAINFPHKAHGMPPEKVEPALVWVLNLAPLKKGIQNLIQHGLEGMGVFLTLSDVRFLSLQGAPQALPMGSGQPGRLVFSPSLEEAILDACATYLRMTAPAAGN